MALGFAPIKGGGSSTKCIYLLEWVHWVEHNTSSQLVGEEEVFQVPPPVSQSFPDLLLEAIGASIRCMV